MTHSVYPVNFPPTWAVPEPILRRSTEVLPAVAWPLMYAFDANTGDFVVDGAGRILISSAHASAAQAAAFLVTVEKAAYPIFRRGFGVQFDDLFAAGLRQTAANQAVLRERMRSAARSDTRVRDLEDFTFDWSGDRLLVGYTLVLADGVRLKQETWLQ